MNDKHFSPVSGMNNKPLCSSISEHFDLNIVDFCCCLPEYICTTPSVDCYFVSVTVRNVLFCKINTSLHSCHSKTLDFQWILMSKMQHSIFS